MATKKPLTFSLDEPPLESVAKPIAAKPGPAGKPAVGRKQVGARIPIPLYRQLKAHAALRGEPVQTILEAAVADYLNQHADRA
jgi:hypothetical protein